MTGHDSRKGGRHTRRARADSYRRRRTRRTTGASVAFDLVMENRSHDKTDKNVYLVRVRVAAAAAGCAVLVVEEHETDGDDADDERQEAHRAKTGRSGAH